MLPLAFSIFIKLSSSPLLLPLLMAFPPSKLAPQSLCGVCQFPGPSSSFPCVGFAFPLKVFGANQILLLSHAGLIKSTSSPLGANNILLNTFLVFPPNISFPEFLHNNYFSFFLLLMSRLGKRRLNCASEEEGTAAVQSRQDHHHSAGTVPSIGICGSGNVQAQQQQQFGESPLGCGLYFPNSAGAYLSVSGGCPPYPNSDYGAIAGLDNSHAAYLFHQQQQQQQHQFGINSSTTAAGYGHHQSAAVGYYASSLVIPCQEQQSAVAAGSLFASASHLNPLQLHEANKGQTDNLAALTSELNGGQVVKTTGMRGDSQIGGINAGAAAVTGTASNQNNNILCCQMPSFFQSRSPFETFCTVPGRTSLLSSTTKYKVTVGEIQRRINPPECLNASLIGGILRKAKSKDGGKALRESLKRIGLSLPAGRRKSACVTAFTALVEEEAVHLANDFHLVLQREFPVKDAALFLNNQFLHFSTPQMPMDLELLNRRRTILSCAKIFLKEFSDLVNADGSPICDRRPELVLDPNIQKPLTHFSLITHGFGAISILAVLETVSICISESLKSLEKIRDAHNAQMPAAQYQHHQQPSTTDASSSSSSSSATSK